MEVKKRIVCFDFDGTLTTRDTLLLFIRFACGRWAFFWGLLCYAPLLVLMKLRLYHNGKTKQKLFSHFFRGSAFPKQGYPSNSIALPQSLPHVRSSH